MELYESKILSLVEENKKIVILTAENRVSLRNVPEKLNQNFIDVGISEQNLIGIGAGLAKLGFLPIMHGMSTFLTMRAFEFIRTDLGYPRLPSVLVGTFNGLSATANGTANGPTHQAIEDIALMRLVPNMTVVTPSDRLETLKILDSISKLEGPLYIRDSNFESMEIEREPFVWGKNDCIVSGEKIAILSYGTMLDICLKASKKLSEKSVSHAIYNMRFLKPMDKKGLEEIFSKFEKIIVVEDHIEIGGLSSIVKEFGLESGKKNKIEFMNLRQSFFRPGNFLDAIQNTELTVGKIIAKVMES